MANSKSAKKRIRSSERRRRINKRIKSLLKMREKLFLKEITGQKKPSPAATTSSAAADGGAQTAGQTTKIGEKSLSLLFSIIDRAKKSGVLHKNAAARKKSRFSRKAPAGQKQAAQNNNPAVQKKQAEQQAADSAKASSSAASSSS